MSSMDIQGKRGFTLRQKAALWLLLAVLFFTPACGPEELNYLLQQAPGQLALLMKRVPFEKMLADPDLDPQVRETLEFVLDVKHWGVENLGLIPNNNYEVYVQLKRETANWNLTAAEPLSMTPLTWEFPLVGKAPYLGFFNKDNAMKKAGKLEAEGYDVYVRTADAYSMLGIVADPLYSPLLKYRKADLANLLIHEMTHGTVFIKGQMEFNENVALFVGNQGAYEYLVERFGPDSEEALYSLGSNQDDMVFSREIMRLYNELDAMYKSDISDDEKRKRKAEIIAEHKRRFREDLLGREMKTGYYRSWPDKEINNATVISRVVYFHDLTLYENLYRAMNEDLRALLDFFKKVEEMEGVDAETFARDWLASRDRG